MDRSALTVGPGMDMPIMHDSDRYELVRDIGSGNFGIARLMRDKQSRELVAVKYIERGEKVVLVRFACSFCISASSSSPFFFKIQVLSFLGRIRLSYVLTFFFSLSIV